MGRDTPVDAYITLGEDQSGNRIYFSRVTLALNQPD